MQVNSDGTVSIENVTISKDAFLQVIGNILHQLGEQEKTIPPKPVEVDAIEEATKIRQGYKDGDYTYPQLLVVIDNFKKVYNERLHFLMDWVTTI